MVWMIQSKDNPLNPTASVVSMNVSDNGITGYGKKLTSLYPEFYWPPNKTKTLDFRKHIAPHQKTGKLETQTETGLGANVEKRKLVKEILHASETALAEFETFVFEGSTFSNIQKLLKSIRKAPAIPPTDRESIVFSAIVNEKSELFSDYVFGTFGKSPKDHVISFEARSLSRYTIDHNQVSDIMKQLNVSKSNGRDKIGNLVL